MKLCIVESYTTHILALPNLKLNFFRSMQIEEVQVELADNSKMLIYCQSKSDYIFHLIMNGREGQVIHV